jgi:hypothetical protein
LALVVLVVVPTHTQEFLAGIRYLIQQLQLVGVVELQLALLVFLVVLAVAVEMRKVVALEQADKAVLEVLGLLILAMVMKLLVVVEAHLLLEVMEQILALHQHQEVEMAVLELHG